MYSKNLIPKKSTDFKWIRRLFSLNLCGLEACDLCTNQPILILRLMNTNSDYEIILDVLSGQTEKYGLIVHKYNPYLYKVGRSYGFNHAVTEDLMQDTYVDAYIHLKTFENRALFKTWIVKIMLNNCFHEKNKSKRFNSSMTTEEMERNLGQSDGNNPIQENEYKRILEESLLKIPEDYRMVFSLRRISGLSISDTAEALNISSANVKVRLNRANAMLKEEIEKVYSTEDLFEFNLIHCDPMVEKVLKKVNDLPKEDFQNKKSPVKIFNVFQRIKNYLK